MNHQTINRAKYLPFLEAVCWDLRDVYCLTPAQMLTRYEKGLEYEGILGELEPDERAFFEELKKDVHLHAA